MHVFHAITQWVMDLIRHSGYYGITLGMTLQAIGVPLPSEVIIPPAAASGGHRAHRAHPNPFSRPARPK